MSESNALVEKRQEMAAKQKKVNETFEKAGATRDFSKKEVLEHLGASDSADAVAKVKQLNRELEAIQGELNDAELVEIKKMNEARDAARQTPYTGMTHPAAPDLKSRSFGELITSSEAYKAERKAKFRNPAGASVLADIGIKTLMTTSAGFGPESPRTGLLVEAVTRPIQVLDLFPVRQINQAVDKYMEETTRTHSAAEKGEGVAYAESAFVWTERTETVRKITDSIPVTDEQLEDEPQVSGLLDQRLRFGLRQRLELQCLVGDGTAPNLSGILDRSVEEQALGADNVFDNAYKAITKVRFTGRAVPGAFIYHPNDWQPIRLAQTADGQYILGNPAQPGANTLFGLPVAISDAITENTALVGDFANFCYIGENRGIEVLVGYSGTQFVEGEKTIRASLRACFTVTRVSAFCKMTGL